MTDRERNSLVEAAQGGDAKAFATLVEAHYGMVHGLAYGKTHDWQAAEDLTQDTFMTAWKNLDRLRHAPAFLVWLRRIARNLSLNWIRTEEYRRKLAEREVSARPADRAVREDPAAITARRECLDQVGEGLRTLSSKLRDAMVLYYIEGQSAADAAEMLGISTDTMKKRLRLGREKLQRFYRRKADYQLEPLLPYKPRKRIENIVAGLAIGPVLPEMAAAAANPGPWMVLGDVLNGASWSVVKGSGFAHGVLGSMAVKSALTAAVVATLAVGAGVVLVVEPGSGKTEDSMAVAGTALVTPGPGEVADAALSDVETTQRYMPVENLFGGVLPDDSPFLPGDRIVKVNGLPISASVREDPRSVLQGKAGTQVTVSVTRPAAIGGGTEEVEITFDLPYMPKRYGGS